MRKIGDDMAIVDINVTKVKNNIESAKRDISNYKSDISDFVVETRKVDTCWTDPNTPYFLKQVNTDYTKFLNHINSMNQTLNRINNFLDSLTQTLKNNLWVSQVNRVYIDSDGLNNVIEYLNNANQLFNWCINIISGISIPSDFAHKDNINIIWNNCIILRDNIQRINQRVYNINSNYLNRIYEYNQAENRAEKIIIDNNVMDYTYRTVSVDKVNKDIIDEVTDNSFRSNSSTAGMQVDDSVHKTEIKSYEENEDVANMQFDNTVTEFSDDNTYNGEVKFDNIEEKPEFNQESTYFSGQTDFAEDLATDVNLQKAQDHYEANVFESTNSGNTISSAMQSGGSVAPEDNFEDSDHKINLNEDDWTLSNQNEELSGNTSSSENLDLSSFEENVDVEKNNLNSNPININDLDFSSSVDVKSLNVDSNNNKVSGSNNGFSETEVSVNNESVSSGYSLEPSIDSSTYTSVSNEGLNSSSANVDFNATNDQTSVNNEELSGKNSFDFNQENEYTSVR